MSQDLDQALWRRLEGFAFDRPDTELTFARRLARENGWPPAYAERVIAEYRRFCYLACRAGHPVTPSDQVDQAWHLHLVYTQSYWHDLCRDVLERPLHHGPTAGGRTEDAKYWVRYQATLESYRCHFGHPPPANIWPPAEERFAGAATFRRVNGARYWLVPKPDPQRAASWAVTLLLALPVLAACVEITGGGRSPWIWIVPLILLLFVGKTPWPKRGKAKARKDMGGDTGCGTTGCGAAGDSGCGGSGCGGGGCSS